MKTRFTTSGRFFCVSFGSADSFGHAPTRRVLALGLRLAAVPALAFLLAVDQLSALTVPRSEYVEGELLVRFALGPLSVQADQINAELGSKAIRSFPACGCHYSTTVEAGTGSRFFRLEYVIPK